MHGPYNLIGFSNGGAVVLDYLLDGYDDVFDKAILAAPLVHFWAWEETIAAYKMYSPIVKAVPRASRKSSSDKEFLKFNRKKDVLHLKEVPMKWVKALKEWNEKIAQLPLRNRKVLIIQGLIDKTVDWKYNVKFIESKFSQVDLCFIERARHALFNESEELRNEVFAEITAYMEIAFPKNDL